MLVDVGAVFDPRAQSDVLHDETETKTSSDHKGVAMKKRQELRCFAETCNTGE